MRCTLPSGHGRYHKHDAAGWEADPPPAAPVALQTITRWALMCEERHNGRTITVHRDRAEALESLIEFLMAGEDEEDERWQDIPRDDLDELTDWCRARAEEQHADFFADEVVVVL